MSSPKNYYHGHAIGTDKYASNARSIVLVVVGGVVVVVVVGVVVVVVVVTDEKKTFSNHVNYTISCANKTLSLSVYGKPSANRVTNVLQ